MSPTAAIFRSVRPVFRTSSPLFTQQYTNAFARQTVRAGRRFQSTGVPTEGIADAAAVKESFLKRMWDSPIGVKTVHFWYEIISNINSSLIFFVRGRRFIKFGIEANF